jgi:hypothetical protein
MEWFGTASEGIFLFFVARKGIPSCVLFRGKVQNGIPRICIYFCSTERNIPCCFLFHRRVRNRIPRFLFRRTTRIPSEITICSVYSVFPGIIFCRKFPNLVPAPLSSSTATSRKQIKKICRIYILFVEHYQALK